MDLARELGLESEEGASLRVVGQTLLAGSQTEAALAAFERSLALLADHDPYESARTQVQWGLAFMAGPDPARGTPMLRKARATFEELGARRDLAAVDAIL